MPVLTPDPTLPATLGELIEYTYANEWVHCKSGKGLYQNALMVCSILGHDTPLASIGRADIDELVRSLNDQGNKTSTINRKLAALSKVMSTAESLGVVSSKPKIKALREPAHRLRWYTKDELVAMEQAAPSRFGDFLRFLADTGLRLSEALNLHHEDIVQDLIIVRDSKNGTSRSIPTTPAVREIISRNWDSHPTHLWGMFTKHGVRSCWTATKIAVGLGDDPHAVLHTFRHTFISRLVQAGVPILTVQKLAGHKTIEMTLRYAHLAPDNFTAAIASIS